MYKIMHVSWSVKSQYQLWQKHSCLLTITIEKEKKMQNHVWSRFGVKIF